MRISGVILAAVVIFGAEPPAAAALGRARLVREIVPGPGSSEPELLGVVNGRLLFFATDTAHGRELWRSDGTPDGTQLVRDIRPGPLSGISYGGWTLFAGRLTFSASDGRGGAQLWTSDGTEAGTVVVRDVAPGIANAMVRLPTPDGDRLWFTAQINFYAEDLEETEQGTEDLWVSDLTNAGTRLVATVGFWEPGFSGGAFAVSSLAPFNGAMLVARRDAFECCESVHLNRVDAAGTTTHLYSENMSGHSDYLPPIEPLVASQTAYFPTRQFDTGTCALWRTDGVAIESIDDGTACWIPLGTVGNDLLLATSGHPVELARATATNASLVPVANLGDGYLRSQPIATAARLYFSVGRSDADELWRTDSAVDPPSLIRRFPRVDLGGRHLGQLMRAPEDAVTFWTTDDQGRDGVLWKSDGTADATRPLAALPAGVSGAGVVEGGSLTFFAAYDSEHGGEVWGIDRAPDCAGDCNANHAVDVAEVLTAVDIALGGSRLDACPAADTDADLRVSIDELLDSVQIVLAGCAEP